jgi:hypothetical protein
MPARVSAGSLAVSLALGTVLAVPRATAECPAERWIVYESTQLFRHVPTGAYVYATKRMAVDADGAPNAYHPNDTGLDALSNAGFPNGNWKGILVVDPNDASRPFVQTSGPHAGFFLAGTRLQDATKPATDPARYVDAATVPYLVFPGNFFRTAGTGDFGDVGVAVNLANGRETPFIVADQGPKQAPLGEVSIKLAEELGGSRVNARNGAGMPAGTFAYIVFPGSRTAARWPSTAEDIAARAGAALARAGGREALLDCVR